MNIGVARGEIQIETGQAISSLNQFGSALQQAGQMGMGAMQAQGIQIQQQGLAFQQLGRVAIGAGAAMAAPFVGAFKAALNFESQMAGVNAVMDLQGDQFQNLSDLASQLGQDTVFTGEEAARAIETLGKAGLSYEQIMGGAAKASTDLAAAAETDVATAADAIAAGIQSFGLSGEEANTVADAIAGAANSSLASMEDIARGFGNVGSTANLAGMDVYDTAAALAVLTDRGQSGTDAATTLRTALQHLLAPTDKAQSLMNDLGLEVVDATGQFVGLEPFARQLVQTFDELGIAEADQIEIMKKLAGQDGMRALVGMVDAVRKEYSDAEKGIDDYNAAVREQGAAERFARERMDSTAGAIERLMGSISVLGERVGAPMLTAIRPVVEILDRIVDAVANLPGPVLAAAGALGSLTAAFTLLGGAGLFAAGHLVEAIGRLTSVGVDVAAVATRIRMLVPVILAVTAALAALGIAWENDFLGMRTTVENFFGGLRDAFNEGVEIAGKLDMSGISAQIYGVSEAIRSLGAEEFAQKVRIIAGVVDDFFKIRDELQEEIKEETPTWTSPQESDPILGDPKMGEDTLNFLENLTTNLEAAARSADKWIGRGNRISKTLRNINKGVEAFASEWSEMDEQGYSGITSATSALADFARELGAVGLADWLDSATKHMASFENGVKSLIAGGINPFSAVIAGLGLAIEEITGIPIAGWAIELANNIQRGTDAAQIMTDAGMNPLAAALGGISVALKAMGLEGLASTFAAASRTVQAFGDAFALATSIGLNPFHAALAGLSEAFGVITGIDMTGLTSAILNLGNAFEDFIGAVTSGDWDTVGEMISDAINVEGVELRDWILDVGLPSLIQFVGDVAGRVITWIQEQISALGQRAAEFKDWLLNVALPASIKFLGSVAGWIQIKLSEAIANVGQLTTNFIDWIVNVAAPKLGEIASSIAGWIQTQISNLVQAVGQLATNFTDWVVNVAAPTLGEIGGSIAGWLQIQLSKAVQGIGELKTNFQSWVVDVLMPKLGTVAEGVRDFVQTALDEITTGLGELRSKVEGWYVDIGSPTLGDVVTSIAGWVQIQVGKLITGLQEVRTKLNTWYVDIGSPSAGEIVANIKSWIEGEIGKIMPKAGEIVEDFKDWAVTIGLPEAENAIKVSADFAGGLLSQLGTAISDAISDIDVGSALSNTFEAGSHVGAFVHNVVAALTDLLNAVFGALADPGAWKNIAIGTAGIGAAFTSFLGGFIGGLLLGESVDAETVFKPITDFFSIGLGDAVIDAITGMTDIDAGSASADPRFGGEYLGDSLSTRFVEGVLEELGKIEIDFSGIPNPLEGLISQFQTWIDEVKGKIDEIIGGLEETFTNVERTVKEKLNGLATALGGDPIFTDLPPIHFEADFDGDWQATYDNVSQEAKDFFRGKDLPVQPGQVTADLGGVPVESAGEAKLSTIDRLGIQPANVEADLGGANVTPMGSVSETIPYEGNLRITATRGVYLTDDNQLVRLTPEMEQYLGQDGVDAGTVKIAPGGYIVDINDKGAITFVGPDFEPVVDEAVKAGIGTGALPGSVRAITGRARDTVVEGVNELPNVGTGSLQTTGTGIASAIDALLSGQITMAELTTFSMAIGAKIGEAITLGLSTFSTSTYGGSGQMQGGGIGTAIMTNLATSIQTAKVEGLSTILNAKISEALSTGMSQTSGAAGKAAGAAGGGIGQSLVASLVSQISGADFSLVGSAISTKISAALATGMTTAGGQAGGAGAAGGAGGGIGASVAKSLVSAIDSADFSAIGQTISTKLGEALQNVKGEGLGAALQGVFDKLAADAASMASSLQPVGAALIEGIAAGTGSAAGVLQSAVAAVISATVSSASGVASSSTPPVGTAFVTGAASGVGPATGTFQSAVDAMIQAAVASGSATATSSAVAVGAGFATGSGTGIGQNTSILQDAVGAMIDAAVASGVGVAESLAPAIGAAIAAGAAAGVRANAAQVATEAAAMVTAAIDAANAAAGISSPSKVFMEMGGYMSEGAALGIKEKAGRVADEARNMVQRAIRETEGLRDINKEVGGNVRGVNAELKSIEEIAGILENAPGWNDFGQILRSSSAGIKDSVGAIREDVKDLVRSVKEQLKDMVHQFREAGKQSGSAIGEGIASGAGGAGSGIGGSIEKTLNSEMANINLDQLVIGRDMFKTAKQGIGELKGVGGELNNILQIAEILENAPGWNDFGAMLRESAGNIQGDVGGARDKFRDIMKEMNQISRDQAKAMKEIMKELASTIGDLASKVGESAGSGMSSGMSKGQESAETAGSDMAYGSVGAIESTIENLKGNLSNVGMGAGQALGGGMQKTASEMTEIGNEVGTALGDGATQGLQDSIEGGSEIAETAGDSLGSSFNSGVAGTIPDAMQLGSQISNSVLEALRASAIGDTEAVRMIGDAFGRAFGQGISSATPEAVQAGKNLTDATETGMIAGSPSAEGTATGVGKDIGSSLGSGIEDACKPVNNAARDITSECAGGGIQAAEGNAVKTAERTGENIGEAVGDGISDAGRDVEREGKNLGMDAVTSVRDAIDSNATKMKASVTSMVNKAKVDPSADAKPVGTNFVQGMIDGLTNKEGALYTKVIQIVNDAIAKANTTAQNASPSKRMIEWGQNVGDGMVVGLASKGDPLVDTMVSMVESVVDAAQIGEVSVGTFTMDAVGQNMKWAASQVNSLLDRGTSERMRALEAYTSNKSGKQSASKASSSPTIQVGDIILKEGDPLYDQAKSFFGSVAAQHIPYYGSSRRS